MSAFLKKYRPKFIRPFPGKKKKNPAIERLFDGKKKKNPAIDSYDERSPYLKQHYKHIPL